MKKSKEIFMYVFAGLLMVFLFIFLFLIVTRSIPAENRDLLNTSAGVIFGWGSAVVFYFFGTSKSSADKNEIMNKNEKINR